MRSWFKNIVFGLLPKARLKEDEAIILMYHSIGDRKDYFSSVSKKSFVQQMEYLHAAGIPVISLPELIRRLKDGQLLGGAVVITFDDGYEDNYLAAFPVLKRFNFPATIFLTTDLIGKEDKRNLSRLNGEQTREMAQSGLIYFEPHTRSHPRLSQLPEDEVREEIVGSKKAVEELTGKTCSSFAYPYGDYNHVAKRLVEEIGFEAACTVKEGLIHHETDPFLLNRNSIDRSTSFVQFRAKVSRGIYMYEKLKVWN